MKKITSIFLSCLLILSMIANVSATTLNETDDAGETKIEYTVGETYTVVIPAEVVVSKDTETPAEYDVVVKDLLIPYESSLVVSVEYEGKLKLFEHAATTLEYQMIKSSDSSVIANGGEVISVLAGTVDEQVEKISAKLIETPIIAGDYEDTATFKINVADKTAQYGEAIQMWEISETQGVDDVWMVYYQPEMETVPVTYNLRSSSGTTTKLYENGTVYITGTGRMEEGVYNYFFNIEGVINQRLAAYEKEFGYTCRAEYDTSATDVKAATESLRIYIDDEDAGADNGKDITYDSTQEFKIDVTNESLYKYIPQKVIIDEGVTNVSESAFMASHITELELPSTIETIDYMAFFMCEKLGNVTLPRGLKTIGMSAFMFCTSLTSITLPDSVTSIGEFAFRDCSNLTLITIPDSVTTIEADAFYGCNNLTDVIYGGSESDWANISLHSSNTYLTNATIHYNATENHYGLVSSVAPTCTEAGVNSYACPCGYEKEVVIPATGHNIVDGFCSLCGVDKVSACLTFTLNTDGESYYISSCDKTISGDLVIPSSYNGLPVTYISQGAFQGCNSLTSAIIPNGITNVGPVAFSNCTSLTSVTLPETLTNVGMGAFMGCTNLNNISFNGTVEKWNGITFQPAMGNLTWNNAVPATEVVCTDGTVAI